MNKSIFAGLIAAMVSSSATAMELEPLEKVPAKKPWTLSTFIKSLSSDSGKDAISPILPNDVWPIIIHASIDGGRNLKTYSNLCQVNKFFHEWCDKLVISLDLKSTMEKSSYRRQTLFAYILWKQLPHKYQNLQSLSLDLDMYDYDFKEVGEKLTTPEKYLDLKKSKAVFSRDFKNSLSPFSTDARLNSLAVVESGIASILGSGEGSIVKGGLALGGLAYYYSRKRAILDQDHPLLEERHNSPHDPEIQAKIISLFSNLTNLTSLSIRPNLYFTWSEFVSKFFYNLPPLTHFSFAESYGTERRLQLNGLYTFKNLHNLTCLELSSFNTITSFEGWGAFKQLKSLTLVLHGSELGRSREIEESLVKNLPQLTCLQLGQVYNSVFPHIAQLGQLETLGFMDSAINDEDLDNIGNLVHLTTLKLIRIAKHQSREMYTEAGLEKLRVMRSDLKIVIQ